MQPDEDDELGLQRSVDKWPRSQETREAGPCRCSPMRGPCRLQQLRAELRHTALHKMDDVSIRRFGLGRWHAGTKELDITSML